MSWPNFEGQKSFCVPEAFKIVAAQAPVPDSKQNTIMVTVNNQDRISGK
jgi:hypothetical protein